MLELGIAICQTAAWNDVCTEPVVDAPEFLHVYSHSMIYSLQLT